MKRLPSIKQLQYLLALHEHQHFGRAAEACFIGQSTLSAAIANLEETMHAQLLDQQPQLYREADLGDRGCGAAQEDAGQARVHDHEPLEVHPGQHRAVGAHQHVDTRQRELQTPVDTADRPEVPYGQPQAHIQRGQRTQRPPPRPHVRVCSCKSQRNTVAK